MAESNSESRQNRINDILRLEAEKNHVSHDYQEPQAPPAPEENGVGDTPVIPTYNQQKPPSFGRPQAQPPFPNPHAQPTANNSVVTGAQSGETFDSPANPGDALPGNITPEQLRQLLQTINVSDKTKPAPSPIETEPEVVPEKSRVVRHTIKGDRAQTGWRGFLAKLGFPIEKSATELQQDAWLRQIQRPIDVGKVIGVLSFKGGVGKTTLAVSVGTALHIESGNPVAVVDIDPNGTLKARAVDKQPADVQTLAERLRSGTKSLQAYAAQTFEKVDLYGSKENLADGELSQDDVHEVLTAMRNEYPVTVVDMPIYSLTSSAILAAVRVVDCLIVVIPPTEESLATVPQIGGALAAVDAENLRQRVVVAFNQHDKYSSTHGADLEEVATELLNRGFNVVEIPYDTGLRNINRFAFESIRSSTRWQFVQLSAAALAAAR